MAFAYCKHGYPDKCTFISVLKAILSQLLKQQTHLVPFYYDAGIQSGEITLCSAKLCKTLLRSLLQNITKVYLVIDGIDECDPGERKQILDYFNEASNVCDTTHPGKLRILFLSRDEPDIKKALALAATIRFGRTDTLDDMRSYVHHRTADISDKFHLAKEWKEYIELNVLDRSDGITSPFQARISLTMFQGCSCTRNSS